MRGFVESARKHSLCPKTISLIPCGVVAGILGHPQVIKDHAHIEHELSHFLGDAANPFGFDDSNCEAAKPGDVFRAVADPYSAAILVVIPINDVVAAVLNTPVFAVDLEHLFGVGLLWSSAGDAVSNIQGTLAGLFLYAVPLDDECLSDVREVEVVVELRSCPDLPGFDSSVIRRRILNELRLLPTPEVKLKILKNSGLVSFDGEVVVSLSLCDQIFGQLPLCQQGIGADILPLDINRIQQRDGHLDFVRAFDFFAIFYRQGADFFWV